MAFTAADVKTLREMTSVGMMDCKKALVECDGDMDKAVEWLREKGLAKAAKKAGRIAAEGMVYADYCPECKVGVVIEVNSQTDFVAKNEVFQDFVERLYEGICKRKNAFACSAKLISYQERDKIDDAGNYYNMLGWAFARGKGKPVSEFETSDRIFAACAGAAIYRREFLEKTGLFDEEHFAYLEDTDIGYRARLLGYENWYEPSAKVYHVGSGTSGSRYNLFKIRYSSRNNIYLIYKNMPVLQILLNLPAFILGFSAKLVFFASKGYGKEYLAGIKNGFFICRKPENRAKKIRFEWKRLGTYFVIEWELFINVFRRFLERA